MVKRVDTMALRAPGWMTRLLPQFGSDGHRAPVNGAVDRS